MFTTHNKTAQFTVYIELRLLNIFHLIEFFRNFLPSKPSYLITEAYRLRKNFQSTALSLIWPVNKTADKITLVHDRSRMVKDDPSEQWLFYVGKLLINYNRRICYRGIVFKQSSNRDALKFRKFRLRRSIVRESGFCCYNI